MPDWRGVIAVIVAMTALRLVYAHALDLRTDEAYYWTWSKENVLSFLDHPPMVAWFIRCGTAVLGDTNLGVRLGGIVAMLVTQLLLADIVRRVTSNNVRAVMLALLLPEAALYYGLLMAKVAPDTALIPFSVAMLWSLVRLAQSHDGRWWLAAGLFAGLSLLSKFTAIMFVPAVLAFALVPDWRWRWLRSPYPYLAGLIAIVVFSPVLIWNAEHDWASFRFQAVRATVERDLTFSYPRRVHRHAVRSGRLRAAAGDAVRDRTDGMARLSQARAGGGPAGDGGAGAVHLLSVEVADPAGRRHLADVPVAGRLCGRCHQRHADAVRRLVGGTSSNRRSIEPEPRSRRASPSWSACSSITRSRRGI